jgi:hypothetical protein
MNFKGLANMFTQAIDYYQNGTRIPNNYPNYYPSPNYYPNYPQIPNQNITIPFNQKLNQQSYSFYPNNIYDLREDNF